MKTEGAKMGSGEVGEDMYHSLLRKEQINGG